MECSSRGKDLQNIFCIRDSVKLRRVRMVLSVGDGVENGRGAGLRRKFYSARSPGEYCRPALNVIMIITMITIIALLDQRARTHAYS